MHQLAKSAKVVVAVVGAGHLPGITENWNKTIDIDEVKHTEVVLPYPPSLDSCILLTT